MTHETHFTKFWRELSAALASEFEDPASSYEAAAMYRGPMSDVGIIAAVIVRRRIAIAVGQTVKAA
jgi:hypothetical protein